MQFESRISMNPPSLPLFSPCLVFIQFQDKNLLGHHLLPFLIQIRLPIFCPMIIGSFRDGQESPLPSFLTSCLDANENIYISLPPGWNFLTTHPVCMMVLQNFPCSKKYKQAHPHTDSSLHAWRLNAESEASDSSQYPSHWCIWWAKNADFCDYWPIRNIRNTHGRKLTEKFSWGRILQ